MNGRIWLLCGSAMLVVDSGVGVAHADQATPQSSASAAADPAGSGEIIVTARRRAENIEKVPIAITAISGAQLNERQIVNENDLQSAVPGLTIRQNGGNNAFNYVIRGQSVDTFSNSPPSVLPYIDEVQIVTHSASTFYDLQGIQVLKGPQGTLFGRNATGGAVLYQTAMPEDTLGGYVDGRYGSYDTRHIEAAVNLPASDAVGLRVAGSYTDGGAYVRDYFTGQKYGANDQKSVRGTLQLRPVAGLVNTTVVQYTSEHGTNTPYELWSDNPCGSTNGSIVLVSSASCAMSPSNPVFAAYLKAHPLAYQGGLDAAIALQRSLGPDYSLASYPPFHHADDVFVINTTSYTPSSNVTLKNIFGYNRTTSNDGYSYDGSPYAFFTNQGTLDANAIKVIPSIGFRLYTRQLSEEFQLQGKALADRLTYVAGVYYLDQHDSVLSPLNFGDFLPAAAPFVFTYTAATKTTSIAGFAQATYKATDQLSLTGGFRYTHDDTRMDQLPGALWFVYLPSIPEEKTTASKPSWTASLDYQVNPSLMLYAATRGSWRSGGFNYSVFPTPVTAASGGNLFLPETTKDVEVGVKYSGRDLGIPITLNADFYNQWVDNIQRAAYISTTAGVSLLTANVPKAEITGFEADINLHVADWLQFGGSGNYTNARYTQANIELLGNSLTYGPFADVPKWSGTLFGEASTTLGADLGKLTLRADAYGQTPMHFSNTSATVSPRTTLPGYTLVNMRLTWSQIEGTRLSASVYVRNLFDKTYYTGGNPAAAGGSTNVVDPGMPRIVGGELRFAF